MTGYAAGPVHDPEIFARYRGIIDDWEAFAATILRPLPTTIWANPLRGDAATLEAALGDRIRPLSWGSGGYRVAEGMSAGHHWAYLAGLFHIQEEVSMLPAQLLGVQSGERVLDLCAAPGNKSAQLAAALGNAGRVIANDRSMGRMRACRQVLERLGLVNVATTVLDARQYPHAGAPYDRVLVDAPCSGEGTCRKLRRWRVDEAGSRRMAAVQLDILRKAVKLCRPGGRVVYSTCTFAPEENECVVDALLRGGAPVRSLPARVPGFRGEPGLRTWAGRELDPQLEHALRIWPHHNDSGGFFIAVLERLEDGEAAAEEPRRGPVLDTSEAPRWLGELEGRWGIDAAPFEGWSIFRGGAKSVYLCAGREDLPEGLPRDALGMRLLHTTGARPQPTTAAAMLLGASARANVVDLEPEQARTFLGREHQSLGEAQTQGCTTGYVIVRYRGFGLGVGLFRAGTGQLESFYPKGWAREVEVD